MGYTESLLADGEHIVLRGKRHWLSVILDARAAVAAWVVALLLVVAIVVANLPQGMARDVMSIAAIILFALGLVILGYRLLQWKNHDYVLTNRRIMEVSGIVNKRSADSSLEKINDLVLEENLIGRLLGYGDLDIVTAAEVAVDRFRMIRQAKDFKRVLLDQKHRLEYNEDIRMPGPPVMADRAWVPASAPQGAGAGASQPPAMATFVPAAAAAGGGAAPAGDPLVASPGDQASARATASVPAESATPSPAPVAAPVAAPSAPPAEAAQDEAREVTQTLSRLADLRDRGAISPEEYEAKKQELLGRL